MNDRQLLHGAAMAELIDTESPVTIHHLEKTHDYAYAFQRLTDGGGFKAVLFKYSTAAKTPWRFGFSPAEDAAIEALILEYKETATFITLICGKDGVCCVSVADLRLVMGPGKWTGLSLSVARPPDSGYRLSGPGKVLLRNIIPKSAWPRALWFKKNITINCEVDTDEQAHPSSTITHQTDG